MATPTPVDTLDSAWDDILSLEQDHQEKGRRQGQGERQRRDQVEGFALGAQKGAQIGAEVGFYLGFAESCTSQLLPGIKEGGKTKVRAEKAVEELRAAATDFPAENDKEEGVEGRLVDMRTKFRLICSLLKLKTGETSPATAASW